KQIGSHIAAIHGDGANDEISAYVLALRENKVAGFVRKNVAPRHHSPPFAKRRACARPRCVPLPTLTPRERRHRGLARRLVAARRDAATAIPALVCQLTVSRQL